MSLGCLPPPLVQVLVEWFELPTGHEPIKGCMVNRRFRPFVMKVNVILNCTDNVK